VKNDDQYLYVVGNGALRIVKAWPANQMALVAKVAIDGVPKKLFVEGDRAVVYASMPRRAGESSNGVYPDDVYTGGSRECTYGYECAPTGDGTMTKMLVFDIANRAAPTKIRELTLSGSLIAARRIGSAIHTVVSDPPVEIPGVKYYLDPADAPCDPTKGEDNHAAVLAKLTTLFAQNISAIVAADVHALLPSITEVPVGPTNGALGFDACAGFYRPENAGGNSFTSLVSLDVAGGAPTRAVIVSDPGFVYASETGLYVSVANTDGQSDGVSGPTQPADEMSAIHRFRIGAAASLTAYEASGMVKGRVLDQFALDEYDGHLRVATTTGRDPDPNAHSTMSVLERDGKALVLRGEVDHIAPGEDIRSVRFDGSRGYVVTFKKTDPLYVFDLGNPNAPAITGELQIPGFSTYMHMMDSRHLLTIGYDADDMGSYAWFDGIRLQIFDVANMADPQLVFSEVIGTRGSSSEALTDHLAFNYFAPKNLLALPMTICEGGGNGTFGQNMTFSGLMVYDVTADAGFHLRGEISHPRGASSNCSNWWTDASSDVKRSVVMDDFVYSISDEIVKVTNLAGMFDAGQVSLSN
jgi:hypothetical protein